MITPLITSTKFVSAVSKILRIGHGSTWPGHIALNINQSFIKEILKKNPDLKIILVAGTNGKTTTSKLIRFILAQNGMKVFQNDSGANLLNGIASSFIIHAKPNGRIPYDVALFEIDENTLPLITEQINPHAILLLNLFRDQLDRYGEVNTIARKWERALANLTKNTNLFVNGDDPQLTFIAKNSTLTTTFFGIEEKLMAKKELSHDTDFSYCPHCGKKLIFEKNSYSHMGIFKCSECRFKSQEVIRLKDIEYPLFGTYNKYNINAALLLSNTLFNIPYETLKKDIKEFKPAFGRQEEIFYKGKKVIILLSKNPASFNQSLQAVTEQNGKHLLLVLNDKIPDGRDVSWIWDVDFEDYINNILKVYISGDRAYDMGLRIKYAGIINNKYEILEDLNQAINNAVDSLQEKETLYILPTYSAMLEVRKILTGKKIL